MKCVIIAGGKGTRLGRADIPKPMARVGGVPIIEHQIRLARRYGYRDIIILAGYLAEVMIDYLGDGSNYDVRIEYLVEEKPLGTGGALLQLMGKLDDDFLVLYGDVFVDMNLRAFEEVHRSSPAIGSLVVHPNSHPYDSDLVEVDETWTVRAFHPKPRDKNRFYRNLVNAALYMLNPEILHFIPRDRPSDLGKDLFPAVAAAGKTLRAYSTPEYLKDMGTPERLAEVEQAFAAKKPQRRNLEFSQKCIFLDRDGIINTEAGGVLRPESFELTSDIVPALRRINSSDFLAIIVTNQPFIAKGMMTISDLEQIHAKMDTLLGEQGVYVDGLYYCPHHPETGWDGEIAELKVVCECRKPAPGMILRAAQAFNVDLAQSYIIGDNVRDTRAGRNAGLCSSLLIAPAEAEPESGADYDRRFASVPVAVDAILGGAL
ncbi:MAG TPA: HAD-IIIA family hydrolase [Spirochaetia bacterium]|nr:HAD-IIIA family hydrolase [Spirochaetia bacterium]